MSSSVWSHGLQPARLLCPWDSPGRNTGVGCHALLQGIFTHPGMELSCLPALAGGFFTTSTIWEARVNTYNILKISVSGTPHSSCREHGLVGELKIPHASLCHTPKGGINFPTTIFRPLFLCWWTLRLLTKITVILRRLQRISLLISCDLGKCFSLVTPASGSSGFILTYLPSYSKKLYQLTRYQRWCLNLPFPLKDAAENGQGHSCPEAMAGRHLPSPLHFPFSFPSQPPCILSFSWLASVAWMWWSKICSQGWEGETVWTNGNPPLWTLPPPWNPSAHFSLLYLSRPIPTPANTPTYTYPLTPADSSIGRGNSGVRTEKPVTHVDWVQDPWVNRIHTQARDEAPQLPPHLLFF